jgi:integrase
MKARKNDKLYEKKVLIPTQNGEWRRKSFYNRDKRTLEIEVNEIKNQINKGIYTIENNSTFEQVAQKWYKIHAFSKEETTRESYEIYMNHAIKLFNSLEIQKIKTSDLKSKYNDFLFKIDENGNKIILHSKNSLKHLHTVVNMIFKFAIDDNILWKNPCSFLNKKEMRPDKFEPYVYTEDEFNDLLEKTQGTIIEIISILAGGVGMRAGEICALKKNKINVFKNQIIIDESNFRISGKIGYKKTKSRNRTVYVDKHIIKKISEFHNDGEYVISRSTQKPYRNDELYHMFTKALIENKLPITRFHDLRHYNATQMALNGIDIKTAAYRLGDTPETVLKIYQHVQEQMDYLAAQKLGNMFKNKNSKHVVESVVNTENKKNNNAIEKPPNTLVN